MKIIFVAPRFHTNQHFWVDTLKKRGHDVLFFVSRKIDVAEHYESIIPEVVDSYELPKFFKIVLALLMRIQHKRLRSTMYKIPRWSVLKHKFLSEKPDVVIVRDVGSGLSLFTFIICKLKSIPVILYSQREIERPERWFGRILQSLLLAPNVRISPIRENSSYSFYPHTNSYYVPLVSNFKYDIAQRDFDLEFINLLFIGKYSLPRKNHKLLLDTLKLLSDEYDIKLTMIGVADPNGEEFQQIRDYVIANELQKIVTLKYNIPFNEITKEYAKHDIFVLPSIDEPFSISPIEAMNHGLPAIITDTNGARFCIRHGENGFVVKSNSVCDLVEKLATIMSKKETLRRMSFGAHRYVMQEHSPDVFYQRIMEAINAVIH